MKKRFLIVVALVTLSVSLFGLFVAALSKPVKAQTLAAASSVILVDESAVRMYSGPILFSDGNVPDFRPHTLKSSKPNIDSGCISYEVASLRRHGGCVE